MKKNQIFKKTISFITATALAFSLVTDIPFWGVEMSITANAAAAKLTDSKTGTSLQDLDGDNYYEISNANELIAFSNLVNTTRRHEYGYMESPYDSINGELTADITMPAGTVWSPIGYYNTYDDYAQYVGMFDGQFDLASCWNQAEIINEVGSQNYNYIDPNKGNKTQITIFY